MALGSRIRPEAGPASNSAPLTSLSARYQQLSAVSVASGNPVAGSLPQRRPMIHRRLQNCWHRAEPFDPGQNTGVRIPSHDRLSPVIEHIQPAAFHWEWRMLVYDWWALRESCARPFPAVTVRGQRSIDNGAASGWLSPAGAKPPLREANPWHRARRSSLPDGIP
jgi:hypothetical protein